MQSTGNHSNSALITKPVLYPLNAVAVRPFNPKENESLSVQGFRVRVYGVRGFRTLNPKP